jgi:small subunit ribosomal protein S6
LAGEYELVLMLDPDAPEDRRDKITQETRGRIESGGDLRHAESWGMRKMAYEIRQRTEADYRFFRFTTDGALLDDLDHNLKITDGVMRFRVFKVDPQAPIASPPATTQPAGVSARAERGERRTAEAAQMAEERQAEEEADAQPEATENGAPAAEPEAAEPAELAEAAEAAEATEPAEAPAAEGANGADPSEG